MKSDFLSHYSYYVEVFNQFYITCTIYNILLMLPLFIKFLNHFQKIAKNIYSSNKLKNN